jgi:hypothetical protein
LRPCLTPARARSTGAQWRTSTHADDAIIDERLDRQSLVEESSRDNPCAAVTNARATTEPGVAA